MWLKFAGLKRGFLDFRQNNELYNIKKTIYILYIFGKVVLKEKIYNVFINTFFTKPQSLYEKFK